MHYSIPDELDITKQPVTTQYHLQRLLSHKTVPVNVSRQKANRIKAKHYAEALEIGIAIHLFTLIREYNRYVNKEEL